MSRRIAGSVSCESSKASAGVNRFRSELDEYEPGNSAIEFSAGSRSTAGARGVVTIGVSIVDLPRVSASQAYAYFYRMQVITGKPRFFIFTDESALRCIRPFGWLIEHVMSRDSFSLLEPDQDWDEMVSKSFVGACKRLDAAAGLIVGPDGVTDDVHNALTGLLNVDVPRSMVDGTNQ